MSDCVRASSRLLIVAKKRGNRGTRVGGLGRCGLPSGREGGGPHIHSAQLFQCRHYFSWTVWHNFSVSASRGKPHVMILELVMHNIWHSQHDVCVFGIWWAPDIVNIELWAVTRPARLQVLLWQNAWWPKWWAKHGKKFGKIGVLRPALHNAWDGLRSKWVLQKIYPATVGNYQMQAAINCTNF